MISIVNSWIVKALKRWVLLSILIFVTIQAQSQSTGDYRSNVAAFGDWNVAANWERFDGATWQPAASAPTSTDGVITIIAGDRINLVDARSVDQVVVNTGGELFIFHLTTPTVFTLLNGPGTDITNNGLLVISLNATLTGAGTIVNNTGGTFIVRNQGILSVTSTNNGLMEVSGTGNFAGTTVTNNATFNLIELTLNLNNATLINYGIINFPSILDSFIAGTGSGVLINETSGTLFKTVSLGVLWIDPTPGRVAFTNRGVVKGYGQFNIRSSVVNTGAIVPGNDNAGPISVSPAFVTSKTPTFNVDIVSSGALAGITYDQVGFTNLDAATINISGATLNVSDNGSDGFGTIYTIFISAATINGTFATVNLPSTLGNLTYNTNTITVQKVATRNIYTWIGGNGSWTTAGNWFPSRITPAATDALVINSGGTVTITNVPTQTLSALTVTNNTSLNLQSSGSSKTLTVGNSLMSGLTVDPGSALTSLDNAGVVLNITLGNSSRGVVGGTVTMQNGTFNVGNATLLLHTNASPLNRVNGQFTLGSNGSLEFGDLTHTAGPVMTIPNNIFVSDPVLNLVSVSRTNGVVFGNQSITANVVALGLGNITTNATGRLRLSATATNPAETATSKIIGYVDVLPRVVGTAAYSFVGLSLAAGSNIGTVSTTRITGPDGINIFNGYSSIAAEWAVTATTQPSPARQIAFSWLSDFDNGANTALSFQDYRFDVGPSWTSVGSLAVLASTGNPRGTTPTGTLTLTGTWTIADQLNVLPITMGEFTGHQVSNSVELEWTTLSELNGDYFEVQRMAEREEGFSVIGQVRAHGTTKETHTYQFNDPEAREGKNYYRLRLVDFDKTFDYSNILLVNYNHEVEFSIYPNPVTRDEIHFVLPDKNTKIRIFDAQQQLIVTTSTSHQEFRLSRSGNNLKPGLYLVQVDGNNYRLMKKLIVR